MTTKAEYAQLSLYVYQARLLLNRPAAPTGWAQLELSSEAIDGFSYGVFRRIGTNEVVVQNGGRPARVARATVGLLLKQVAALGACACANAANAANDGCVRCAA